MYPENLKKLTNKLQKPREFSKVTGYKVKIQKSITFLCNYLLCNKQVEY